MVERERVLRQEGGHDIAVEDADTAAAIAVTGKALDQYAEEVRVELAAPPVPTTLYAIEDDLSALLNSIEMIPESDQEARLQILDEIALATDAAKRKRDGVARYIKTLGHMQELCKAEEKLLAAKRRAIENHEERIRNYVRNLVDQHAPQVKKGARKLAGNVFELALRKGKDGIEIDERLVPAQYKRASVELSLEAWETITEALPPEALGKFTVSTTVDRKALQSAVDIGVDVPGVDRVFGEDVLVVK